MLSLESRWRHRRCSDDTPILLRMSPASRPRRRPLRKAQRREIAGDIARIPLRVDAQACRTLGGAPSNALCGERVGLRGTSRTRCLGLLPLTSILSADVGYPDSATH